MTIARRDSLARCLPVLLVLAAGLGAAGAMDDKVLIFAIGGLACLMTVLLLPERFILYLAIFSLLSGFRPLPSIAGFHIEAQYFLLPPLTLRLLTSHNLRAPIPYPRAKTLAIAIGLMIVSALIGFARDLYTDVPDLLPIFADLLKWMMNFVLLGVLVWIALRDGESFARRLYVNLLRIFAVFAFYAMADGASHIRSLGDVATTRFQIPNIGPASTGGVAAVAVLMTLAPIVVRRLSMWEVGGAGVFLVLLALTGAREGVVALGVGLVVLGLHIADRRVRVGFFYAFGALSVLAAAILLSGIKAPTSLGRTVFYANLVPYLHLFGFNVPSPLAERIYLQTSGLAIFLAHPLLGLGWRQYLEIPTGNALEGAHFVHKAHDSFISIGAQQGIPGLLIFVFFIVTSLRIAGDAVAATRATGRSYDLAVAARCGLIALIVASFGDDYVYYDYSMTALFMVVLAIPLVTLLLVPVSTAAPARLRPWAISAGRPWPRPADAP